MISFIVLIIYFLKFITWALRTFTGNSGTALPGLVLEKYFPNTAKKLLQNFEKVILVTGTNGKTTTTQMICHLLGKNDIDYVTNKSGSNLVRGILSSLIQSNINSLKSKVAVFEVEEGSMPRLTKLVKANVIIVTNIFRDQLDAYGEIDKTWKYIKSSIEQSDNPVLILNGDDERVSSLGQYSSNKKYLVKLNPKYLNQIKFEESNKNFELRIEDDELIEIQDVMVNEDLSSSFNYKINEAFFSSNTKVPGLHNVINAVYAQTLFKSSFDQALNIDISDFEPAFGRGEIIEVKSEKLEVKGFQILLAKNPAGLNLNFHLLENVQNRESILLILNDKIADGRDISWIWDVDFSILQKLGFKQVFIAGTRRYDMALRCKYENIQVNKIFESIEEAVGELTQYDFEKVFVLPTYTAMREFRDELSKYTNVKKMWE